MNRRRYRCFAALAVATLVLGQLQTSVHRASVRHVVCAEHGELIEAPELVGTIDGESRLVEVTLGVDSDDHCAAANGLRPHLSASAGLALIALVPHAPVTMLVAVDRGSALTGYRIAPKTSPPDLAFAA